jgi:enoyl-CoA hydratase/carnithine racemase
MVQVLSVTFLLLTCYICTWCRYRVCTESPRTKLGLPEVMLGILPGAGGTQRLPKLIGLAEALPLMLTGSNVVPSKAKRLGIVDQTADPNALEFAAIQAADNLASGKLKPNREPQVRQHRAHSHTHAVTHTRTHAQSSSSLSSQNHMRARAHTHTHTQTHRHANTHTHTHTNTRTHTHTHTHCAHVRTRSSDCHCHLALSGPVLLSRVPACALESGRPQSSLQGSVCSAWNRSREF